jgi:ferredoxin
MGLRTDLMTALIHRTFNKRFAMARSTRLPLLGRAVTFALFEKDEMVYLPKDDVAERALKGRTIRMDKDLAPENFVLPSTVVEHFIRESRYIFIMRSCMCRESNGCEHYPADMGCIFLGKGTLKIPEKMGHRATKEEALDHLRGCREAGLVHLIGRNKIDSVWLNSGPKEDLMSLCSCCPCCCLWRMLPELSHEISDGVRRMPGVTVKVDGSSCTGCGICVTQDVCFVRAITMVDDLATIDQAMCKGCGRCVDRCRQGAIEMSIDDPDYFRRSVETIEPLVDVRSG